MKHSIKALFVGCFILITAQARTQTPLEICWKNQVEPLAGQYFSLQFEEKINTLEHDFEPWKQTNRLCKGAIWTDGSSFLKCDTLTDPSRNRSYFSNTQLMGGTLLFLDYGDKDLFAVTRSMVQKQLIETARYSPIHLINYFHGQHFEPELQASKSVAVYRRRINKTIVALYVNTASGLVTKITTLSDDELFGDVETTFEYKDYAAINQLNYPKRVIISKINGKLTDEVSVLAAKIQEAFPPFMEEPSGYTVKEDVESAPEIKVEKYSSNIHFIELKHTDDRVMVVEFEDFLLVAEAPLNSENGELIIAETQKIAPQKTIKYFVFGHHHPHYLGGIRPFIHAGAQVICTAEDADYVQYIANASHSINADKLHNEPKPVIFDYVTDVKTITDGNFEMQIHFIGNQSEHTNDYLIYYFPSERLLFEDDLVWIAREGGIEKASGRQAGLYNAVTKLGLDIETIIQSWPVADYGVKTVIPFDDLETSMKQK